MVGSTWLGLADHDLLDVAVLAKEFGTTERLQQGLFIFEGRNKSNDIDQVLLLHAYAGEISTRRIFNLSLLGLLSLGSSLLFVLVQLVELKFFSGGDLVLNGLLVVRSSAVGAGALFIGILETVEAELTNLRRGRSVNQVKEIKGWQSTYLVAARTRSEVFVREVKFFDTQGTEGAISWGVARL